MEKLNFERLTEVVNEIKETEEKIAEILPKVKEEGSQGGKYSSAYYKLVEKRKGLQSERNRLNGIIATNREPQESPILTVARKYSRMDQHNRRIRLLASIVHQIKRLQVDMAEFHNTTIPVPFSPMDGTAFEYVSILESMYFNLTRKLNQMRPLTEEGFKQELAAAKETLASMRQEVKEREEILHNI